MAQMMASAATGVLSSVIDKLGAMLTDKYNLARDVKQGIRSLRDELSSMDAVLRMLADKDDDRIDPLTKDWRSKVRELSYDIEDCIDRFVLNHSSHGDGGSTTNFVHKAIQMVKRLFKDRAIAEEIRELKKLVSEQSERGKRYYEINQCLLVSPQPVLLDPRAPALFQEERDLVGIDAPREEIIKLLKCEDKEQDKGVSIYGIGGQGKTTLAMEVYHKITEPFDCRAFVSVSQSPDMQKLLRDILSQISKSDFDHSQKLETVKQLIRTVKECLMDKRYFILIDDIWDVSAWGHVRSALPLNDNGSRIITTTRIKAVAKSCSTGIAAQMYEAKPLSVDDSQKLFFKRLFFQSEDCPPDFREVCSDILKKCGGLPLAIISMAGLLANRSQTVEVWRNVLRSISAAVDKDSPIDKMKRILLLSYFDLPHHLKNCVLYLSVFPEDYSIDCQQLILLWVAEGLILGQDRETMEQQGRNYLNELMNRSLVQPTNVAVDGTTVKRCRVHDVILEFIVSKAVEDNFVTIWNGNTFSENYTSYKIRRLSIQNISGGAAEVMAKIMRNAPHIRSITIFGNQSVLVNKLAEFLNIQVLRVLNIEHLVKCNLGHVKSFGLLKYLSVGQGGISIPSKKKGGISRVFKVGPPFYMAGKLPKDIEKLQHLETLDVRHLRFENIPTGFIHLQKLVRLFVSPWVELPDAIKNLQALEELSMINLGIQSIEFIQGLSDLINLRVLGIDWQYTTEVPDMEGHKKACSSTLSKLFIRLRELHMEKIRAKAICSFMSWFGPTSPLLRKLGLGTQNFNILGPQINSLVHLTHLIIDVRGEVGMEGINILGCLPMLLSLNFGLHDDNEDGDSSIVYPRNAITRQGFQLLVKFHFRCFCVVQWEFEPEAMPKLQRLKLALPARYQFKCGEGGLVLGLQNLAGLKHVDVQVYCSAAVADEVEALEDDIRSAADAHANRPVLQFERVRQRDMAQGHGRIHVHCSGCGRTHKNPEKQ